MCADKRSIDTNPAKIPLFNRELSWLEFNYRVLEEALDKSNPLLERLKFISIFTSNLDEFFMVRISGIISQVRSGLSITLPSGDTPGELLNKLKERILSLVKEQHECFTNEILPELKNEGFEFYTAKTLPKIYIDQLKELFMNKHFLILTPMAIDPAHPFPFLSGKLLNLLIKLEGPDASQPLFAVIPLPSKNRFVPVVTGNKEQKYILIEEYVKLFADTLFKGYNILNTCTFRITRDAEISLDEDDVNLLSAVESGLKQRDRGYPIRLEVENTNDKELIDFLYQNIQFVKGFDFNIDGFLDLSSFFPIALTPGYEHIKGQNLPPSTSIIFKDQKKDIFSTISKQDIMLFHPFESFDPVVNFIDTAAEDPQVLAIKMTLYRTSGDSPIISALKKAADNGKQVTVIVEVRARFDEAQNITWAKQLEQSGCHVTYGVVGLKTHSKIALVVRDEEEAIKRYIHLSTGNYNDKTARIYTDIGLFTARKSFGMDVSAVFNLLTGYSAPPRWKKIVTAPLDLRTFFYERINIEKEHALSGGKAKIVAKMNALIDMEMINALYEASKAGVDIYLIIRGMCRLKPGLKGISENIKVISIVDQFLEHSRIFYFYNAGEENIYCSSADWMERNLDKRVEILFPIESEPLKNEVKSVLKIIQKDNQKARVLKQDGKYYKVDLKENEAKVRSQRELYNYFYRKNNPQKDGTDFEFIPKASPDNQYITGEITTNNDKE